MSYLKRQSIPKKWSVHRKGTKYVVKPSFSVQDGVPILIILRDILEIAQNRREVKKAIREKNILLNNRIVKDEKHNALLFDTISIIPSKKYYRLELSDKGKFKLTEINAGESTQKISKIINKKILKGKKTQLNLSDGKNFLSGIKCKVNDSVLIDLKQGKILKCLSLKEKAKVVVFAGKHSGEIGIINKINLERKMADLSEEGKKVDVLIKQLMVVE